MKKHMYKFAAVMIGCFLTISISAQDIIKQKNGEELEVRIVEMADDYVIYYHFDDPNEVKVKMNRSLIREIEYEYGRKETEVAPGVDESYFVDDKRNNIKLNFSAIASTATVLTYERALDYKSSWEATANIQGLGINNDEERSGFGLGAAYKVKFGGLFKKDDYRPSHLLHGTYLRPNLGFISASFDTPENDFKDYSKYSYVHGGLDIGRQWVLNNSLVLDLYGGLAYYGGNFELDEGDEFGFDDEYIDDGNLVGANNTAFKYGLQIGFLFDGKK